MRTAKILAFLVILLMPVMPGRAYGPDESKWSFTYAKPEDLTSVVVTLSYRWWDPKVDGDLASKKVLLTTPFKFEQGAQQIPIHILLNGGKSVLVIGNQVFRGKGYLLDPTFTRLATPKLDYNNLYVLAQQPIDLKNPAVLGDVQNASAWIELGIDAHP